MYTPRNYLSRYKGKILPVLVIYFLFLYTPSAAFFPIGAWFPEDGTASELYLNNTVFPQVKDANFNTIHGPRMGDTGLGIHPQNTAFLNAAANHNLKVQLYSWDWLFSWLTISPPYYATQPFSALHDMFLHGSFGTEPSEGAVVGQVAVHNTGYMLQHNTGYSNGVTLSDDYDFHIYRLAVSDNSYSSSPVVRLEVTDTSNNPIDFLDLYPQDFISSNVYQEFYVESIIPLGGDIRRYRVWFYDTRDIRLNKISPAHEMARDLLVLHSYDSQLQQVTNNYISFSALWRYVAYDEPPWQRLESVGYVEDYFQNHGEAAISAIGNHELNSNYSSHTFTDWTTPDVFLVDMYPIGDWPEPWNLHGATDPVPLPSDPNSPNYNTALQERWDSHLIPALNSARDRLLAKNIPFGISLKFITMAVIYGIQPERKSELWCIWPLLMGLRGFTTIPIFRYLMMEIRKD